jgi:hypothetical protein
MRREEKLLKPQVKRKLFPLSFFLSGANIKESAAAALKTSHVSLRIKSASRDGTREWKAVQEYTNHKSLSTSMIFSFKGYHHSH